MKVGEKKTLTISKPVSIVNKGGYIAPLSVDLDEGLYELALSLTYKVTFDAGTRNIGEGLLGSATLNYSLPYQSGDTRLRATTPIKGQRGSDIWIQEIRHESVGLPETHEPTTFDMKGLYDCRAGSQNLEFYVRLDSLSMPRGIMSLQCTAGKLDIRRKS